MYVETITNDGALDEQFIRFESEDHERLVGKRINGRGEVVGLTNAVGELHPAMVHVDGGEDIAAHEIAYVDWDGRHGWINTDLPDLN
jgi:hypothetical protein